MLRKLFAQAKDKAVQLEPVSPATRALWQRHCTSLPLPLPYRQTLATTLKTVLSRPGCHSLLIGPTEISDHRLSRCLEQGGLSRQHWCYLDYIPNLVPAQRVVISNLAACFERSIAGFTALEHLAQLIHTTPETTWLIGCSDWLWHYLSLTLQFDAVATTVTALPSLTATELQLWLEGNAGLALVPTATAGFYATLASQAQGLPSVAAALWSEALRLNSQGQVCLGEVVCPEMPQQQDTGRFVLHSLLLQPGLTAKALTATLGCDRNQAQARLQALAAAGLIDADQLGQYRVQPLYYPSIRATLASNNFGVPEEAA